MLKSNAILEIKRGERLYQFHLSPESPLGELHDVLHEMQMHIIATIQNRAKERVTEEKAPSETPKDEVA